ncbi:MAG: MBL fold metallo-hydrolase [bacterium]
MSKLIFYGGVNEVGGNKVFLEDQDTRLYLDMGKSYSQRNRFFKEPFLAPRDLKDLLELGILDPLPDLFRIQAPGQVRPVDAVLLSHAHSDHADYISLIHPLIPVYLGEMSKVILDSVAATSFRTFENNWSENQFCLFHPGQPFTIGKLEVEPFPVDHAIPGSFAFILHTTAGPLVYTGDFRLHGPQGNLSEAFLKRAAELKPIAMISEATNFCQPPLLVEEEIQGKLEGLFTASPGIALISFWFRDFERYRTILRAAQTAGRKFVLSLKQAYFLRALERVRSSAQSAPPISLEDSFLFAFVRRRGCVYGWELEMRDYLAKRGKIVSIDQIRADQSHYLVSLSDFDLPELLRLKPQPGSLYVRAMSEPFNSEMEEESDRQANWLDAFGLPSYLLHGSAHVLPHELRQAIARVQPKKLFLIHSEKPEAMARYLTGTAGEIIVPVRGHPYEL